MDHILERDYFRVLQLINKSVVSLIAKKTTFHFFLKYISELVLSYFYFYQHISFFYTCILTFTYCMSRM